MKWEYEIVRQDTIKSFQMSLNYLGSHGWEAVSANYVLNMESDDGATANTYRWIAVMKRPIETYSEDDENAGD